MHKNIDIAMIRANTPASRELIHFNNAGASLAPSCVQRAILQHLQLEQQIGAYEAAKKAVDLTENFYSAFARLLNCSASEIAWADSATHAWNTIIQALPLTAGDRILTGQNEYASNILTFLHLKKTKNIQVQIIPSDDSGLLDLESLEAAIDASVKLIALTHVASHNGLVQPARQVGSIAKRKGVLFILDACQSAGQIALDVEELQCDILTGTGRKYLRGPRGSGFLYLRKDSTANLIPTSIDLHSAKWISSDTYQIRDDARRFESFEHFVAGKIGLGMAVDYALEIGIDAIALRIAELARYLRESLSKIEGVSVHETIHAPSGIVSFSSSKEDAASVHSRLQNDRINSSIIYATNSLLDSERLGLGDRNRASVHYYNTKDEIDKFCSTLSLSKK